MPTSRLRFEAAEIGFGTMATLAECLASVPQEAAANKDPHVVAFYEELLTELGTNRPLNVLEVGVLRGGHILGLLRRLPKSRIVGVDIEVPPAAFWEDVDRLGARDRVDIRIGSQTDVGFLQSIARNDFDGPLDFVTDDALHTYRGARPTFEALFMDWVREGGIYCIEDWGAGYFVVSQDGHPNGHRGLPKLVKQLVDQTAIPDRTVAWKGEQSLPQAPGEMLAPIRRAVIAHGVTAFYRGPGDWMAPLSMPWIDTRVIRRDAEQFAKRLAKGLASSIAHVAMVTSSTRARRT